MIPAFVPMMHYVVPTKLIDVITHLGLQANLRLCLDAGDSASYSGSGQVWSDTSGGGFDFNRGNTTSSETSDPTFNGVAGNQSRNEYWSFDGGDYFTLGQTNPAWLQTFHKDGAKFTIAQWVYANALTTSTTCAIIGDTSTGTGINLATSSDGLFYSIWNGATQVGSGETSVAISNNAWNFLAVSLDEAAGNVVFNTNGTSDPGSGFAYTGHSTGNAGATLQLGAVGGNFTLEKSGSQRAGVAMWDRALSAAELINLFNATRGKFGI